MRPLATLLLLFSLTACAGLSSKTVPPAPPAVQALTQPTQIEGQYKSSEDLALDPTSTGGDLTTFALQAEGAVKSCNIDKGLLREYLVPAVIAKCKWYQFGCKK